MVQNQPPRISLLQSKAMVVLENLNFSRRTMLCTTDEYLIFHGVRHIIWTFLCKAKILLTFFYLVGTRKLEVMEPIT